jgi:glycosyltransferase involved in cell wall biosynthesis
MQTNSAPRALNFFPTHNLNPITGYGKFELGLNNALREAGVKVHTPDFPQFGDAEHTLLIGNPEWIAAKQLPGKVWIWTMIETNRISEKWVNAINAGATGVFVTAPHMVDIFKKNGVSPPVYHVPLGLDYVVPQYVHRMTTKPFYFLGYTYGDLRKGAELTLLAFNRLFEGNHDVRLILKTRNEGHWVRGLRHDQVDVVAEKLPEDEWQKLMWKCHCMVFPSRGEGFGLPPREATLTGMPTIATEWMGMWDVNRWGFPIDKYELKKATFDEWDANEEGSLWAEPDFHVIMEQMLTVYNGYKFAVEIARIGRNYLLSNNRWSAASQRVLRLMANHD